MSRSKAGWVGWRLVVLVLCALGQLACSRSDRIQADIDLPAAPVGLETMDRPVAEQYEKLRADLIRLQQTPSATPDQLARALGELGLWYHANSILDSAERCYLQAAKLAPDGFPWSYYLAHVYSARGAAEKARSEFEQVLDQRPDHVPSLVWLGEIELKDGNLDRAQACYENVLDQKQSTVAALLGLGRVALARRDFKQAAEQLEAALAEQPDATPIQYNLGLAYRGLGETAAAERLLAGIPDDKQAQNLVVLDDPLIGRLESFKLGAREHQRRGDAAQRSGRYAEAIVEFQRAIEIAPDRPEYHAALARVLHIVGRRSEAVDRLEKVVELQPENTTARCFLAGVLTGLDRFAEAKTQLEAALKLDPGLVETHYQLGNLDRAQGRCQPALAAYAKALELEPSHLQSRFWSAVCLIWLGRLAEADRALQRDTQSFPSTAVFTMLRSRLLSTRRGAAAKDLQSARHLADQAFASAPTLDNAETVAMARAALGEFEAAILWQQSALVSAQISGRSDLVEQVRGRLELYRAHQPCREPWLAAELPSSVRVRPPLGGPG